ncbi:MAG: hypothetical protein MJY62_05935 [Bacteroidales bacterium]|nr:hypothetical protein [Bacteroidales bacterium]
MVKFIGEYTAKLDDKGRLVFPAQLKAQMKGLEDMRFVIKKDIYAPCLQMYLFEEWERESEKIKSGLNLLDKAQAMFWRGFMRERALVEPDEKTGRILVPKALLEKIGIDKENGKEVVFSGNDHMIEIWSKDNFENSAISEDDFAALAQKLSSI